MPAEMVWELRLSVLQTVLSWTATVVASVLLTLTSWRSTVLACLDIISLSRKLPVSVRTLIISTFPILRWSQGTLLNGKQLSRPIYADSIYSFKWWKLESNTFLYKKNYVTESNLGSISRFQRVSRLPNPLLLTESQDCFLWISPEIVVRFLDFAAQLGCLNN